jgi:hypothetical protein
VLQALLDESVWARQYFSNAFNLYSSGVYAGMHRAVADKSQTDSVESSNAELRHDLARLGGIAVLLAFDQCSAGGRAPPRFRVC